MNDRLTKGIVWASCAGTFVSAVLLSRAFGVNIGQVFLFISVGLQIVLMTRRTLVPAYQITASQLFLGVGGLFMYLYPLPDSGLMPPISFRIAIWIWIAGTVVLASAGFECLKAVKRLRSNATANHSVERPAAR